MAVAQSTRRLTEAEYLAAERAADTKSEFFEGEVFAMSGGSPVHSLIATNLLTALNNRLKSRKCVPFNSDLRLKVEASGLVTYPDVSVVCGPLHFTDAEEDTVTNPTLVAEVLSDTTEAWDRGKKFENYRLMPSLKEYLLVSQRHPHIEQFVRQGSEEWRLREASGLDASLTLGALRISLPLAEVFARVEFGSAPRRSRVKV